VEQNAHQALALADHAYVLEQGRISLDGTGRELLSNPAVVRAYLGVAPAQARADGPGPGQSMS
jgi:branched-chain amino acid transport system ATP-binding protein